MAWLGVARWCNHMARFGATDHKRPSVMTSSAAALTSSSSSDGGQTVVTAASGTADSWDVVRGTSQSVWENFVELVDLGGDFQATDAWRKQLDEADKVPDAVEMTSGSGVVMATTASADDIAVSEVDTRPPRDSSTTI